jgi:hypothetical protein
MVSLRVFGVALVRMHESRSRSLATHAIPFIRLSRLSTTIYRPALRAERLRHEPGGKK